MCIGVQGVVCVYRKREDGEISGLRAKEMRSH